MKAYKIVIVHEGKLLPITFAGLAYRKEFHAEKPNVTKRWFTAWKAEQAALDDWHRIKRYSRLGYRVLEIDYCRELGGDGWVAQPSPTTFPVSNDSLVDALCDSISRSRILYNEGTIRACELFSHNPNIVVFRRFVFTGREL